MSRPPTPATDARRPEFERRWRQLFAPRTGDLRTELAAEAAAFLGVPLQDALARLEGASERFADEWRAQSVPPSDPERVAEFYNHSQTELFDLLEWHATDAVNHRALACTEMLIENLPAGRRPAGGRPAILDYGSGIGTAAIVFADAGFDVTLADVSERLLAFARWRMERRGFQVRTIDLKRDRPPAHRYDGAVCFDVLEHIPRPLRAVRGLRRALVPGGLLFLVAQFGADAARPMHVVHDDRVFSWFRALGLRRRDDLEDLFPRYVWGGKPQVYERASLPGWKRAAYLAQDVVLPSSLADTLRRAWHRVHTRSAA